MLMMLTVAAVLLTVLWVTLLVVTLLQVFGVVGSMMIFLIAALILGVPKRLRG